MESRIEVWQRGPITGVPGLLQPIAHALLEVGEQAHGIMEGFPEELLWERPAGVASPAFHLKHIRGVIDRLFTYARKGLLSAEQMQLLSLETKKEEVAPTASQLLDLLDKQITAAVDELKTVKAETLTEARGIGRRQVPTTLIGLYTHSAEHSMRHIGQLLVTTRILKGS
ncbi:MAG: DinB family protein [Ginsengibacter sp.]